MDDRTPLSSDNFLSKLFGKLYADKGYISQKLAEMLFQDGIHLIPGIRNKMKNSLMSMYDKILPGADCFAKLRTVIDTTIKNSQNVLNALANIAAIESTAE